MLRRIKAYYYMINPRHRAYVPLVPACIATACLWSVYVQQQEPAQYASSGRIVVSGRMNLPEANAFTEELNNFLGTQVEILGSDELAVRARQQLLLDHPELAGSADVHVTLLRGTSILLAEATGSHPDYTVHYLDALLQQYIESRRDRRIETTLSAMKQIREELPRVEQQLAEQEDQLFRFKEKHNMGYWGRQSADAGQLLSQLKVREANLRMQLNLAESMRANAVTRGRENRLSALEALGGAGNRTEAGTDPRAAEQTASLRQQLIKLQVEREQLLLIYKPKHPRLVRLDQEIQRQSRLLELLAVEGEQSYGQTINAMKGELDSVIRAIAEWEAKALESTRAEAEYEKIQTALTRTRELHARLLGGLQTIDVGRGVNVDIVQILQHATPARTVRRSVAQALRRGTEIGFVLGVLLLLTISRLDQRAYSPAEIARAVKAQNHIEIPLISSLLKVADAPPGPNMPPAIREAMRKLAAELGISSRVQQRTQVIFCVSTTPGEGKSTVALNLALQAANTGCRTLLIDGDLRRGLLAQRLGIPAGAGLADIIVNRDADWRRHLHHLPVAGLDFLARGTQDAQAVDELVNWFNEERVAELRQDYQLVVIDAAPLAPVADSMRLLKLVDQVLLITRIKSTHLSLAEKIASLIRQLHAAEFRLVVNGVRDEHVTYGYYADRYGYY